MRTFQMIGLPHEAFAPLFERSDEALAQLGARRVIADESPGYPCRISLEDAEVGDELLLLSHLHQSADSPYRACGPIYVRRGARQRVAEVGDVPAYVSRRLISVRAYDRAHMIVGAEVCDGTQARAEIERQFADARVAYIHLHNAKRGCFSCLVQRAERP